MSLLPSNRSPPAGSHVPIAEQFARSSTLTSKYLRLQSIRYQHSYHILRRTNRQLEEEHSLIYNNKIYQHIEPGGAIADRCQVLDEPNTTPQSGYGNGNVLVGLRCLTYGFESTGGDLGAAFHVVESTEYLLLEFECLGTQLYNKCCSER
jgi:hypothetical protein